MIASRYHIEVFQGITNVIPTNDVLDHAISTECNCAPRVEDRGCVGMYAFHNLMQEIEDDE